MTWLDSIYNPIQTVPYKLILERISRRNWGLGSLHAHLTLNFMVKALISLRNQQRASIQTQVPGPFSIIKTTEPSKSIFFTFFLPALSQLLAVPFHHPMFRKTRISPRSLIKKKGGRKELNLDKEVTQVSFSYSRNLYFGNFLSLWSYVCISWPSDVSTILTIWLVSMGQYKRIYDKVRGDLSVSLNFERILLSYPLLSLKDKMWTLLDSERMVSALVQRRRAQVEEV